MGKQIDLFGAMDMVEDEEKTNESENQSRLIVIFESIGSAIFKVQSDGVTPVQMLALAEWLRWEATSNLNMMKAEYLQQAQMRKLAVPTPKIEIAK